MALQQVYWNQRQAVLFLDMGGGGASSMHPGLLHPENQQLPTSPPIHQPFTDIRCGLGSTSHSVRDVELEENDTEGGEKDKVQLGGLTDRVIVWLTTSETKSTTSTTQFYTPMHAAAIYQHARY